MGIVWGEERKSEGGEGGMGWGRIGKRRKGEGKRRREGEARKERGTEGRGEVEWKERGEGGASVGGGCRPPAIASGKGPFGFEL